MGGDRTERQEDVNKCFNIMHNARIIVAVEACFVVFFYFMIHITRLAHVKKENMLYFFNTRKGFCFLYKQRNFYASCNAKKKGGGGGRKVKQISLPNGWLI